jgi:choline dehydrogenase-like flavoprotein
MSSATVHVEAMRELILCGGVFNSPQLLMLSGIGPAAHLRGLGIAPRVDLPVGRNLRDHLMVGLRWRRLGPGPFRRLMRADRIALAMAQAWLFRTGPASTLPLGLLAFLRTRPALEAPDLEFLFRAASLDPRPWFPGVTPTYEDAITVNHPLGTCAMGRGSDAVLNPDLRVRGVEALRVVDAAALPDMPPAHIDAMVMMLAERASDLIRGRPPLAPANV